MYNIINTQNQMKLVKWAWIIVSVSSKDEGIQTYFYTQQPENLINVRLEQTTNNFKTNFNTHPHVYHWPGSNFHIAILKGFNTM